MKLILHSYFEPNIFTVQGFEANLICGFGLKSKAGCGIGYTEMTSSVEGIIKNCTSGNIL